MPVDRAKQLSVHDLGIRLAVEGLWKDVERPECLPWLPTLFQQSSKALRSFSKSPIKGMEIERDLG
jgi:hypothetical protein